MTSAQEKMGRRIAAAIQELEFNAESADTRTLSAEVKILGITGARVEVRHPRVRVGGGVCWLVGIVSLEPEVPEVVYAEPMYRQTIERVVARVGGVR